MGLNSIFVFLERGIARGPPGLPGPPGPAGAAASGFTTATIDYSALIRSNFTKPSQSQCQFDGIKDVTSVLSSPSQIQSSAHGSAPLCNRVLPVFLVYLVLPDLRVHLGSLQLCTGPEVAATAWRTFSVICKVSYARGLMVYFHFLLI